MTRRIGAALALVAALAGSANAQIIINELRIDEPTTTDPSEYLELAGPPGASLDFVYLVVLGDSGDRGSGVVEEVTNLAGQRIDANGYFVAAESSFMLGSANLITILDFEDSDNVTFFLVTNFTGAIGDDLDTNDDGVLDVTPWDAIVDRVALIEEENPPVNTEYHYGPPTIGPDGTLVPSHVFRCADSNPAGVFRMGSFDPALSDDTPGAENRCPMSDAGMPDAAPGPDAATPATTPDAAPELDAAPGGAPDAQPSPTSNHQEGCSCRTGGRGAPGTLLMLLLAIGMSQLRRRRA